MERRRSDCDEQLWRLEHGFVVSFHKNVLIVLPAVDAANDTLLVHACNARNEEWFLIKPSSEWEEGLSVVMDGALV